MWRFFTSDVEKRLNTVEQQLQEVIEDNKLLAKRIRVLEDKKLEKAKQQESDPKPEQSAEPCAKIPKPNPPEDLKLSKRELKNAAQRKYWNKTVKPFRHFVQAGGTFSLQASFAQNSEIDFPGASNNRQCLTMALMSIFWSRMKPAKNWNSETMDVILRFGNQLYERIMQAMEEKEMAMDPDGLLAIEELRAIDWPQTINGTAFNIEFGGKLLFGKSLMVNADEQTLEQKILSSLEDTNAALMIVQNQWFALFHQDETIYFFNSHPVDALGKYSWEGQSTIVASNQISLIVGAIQRACENDATREFQIHDVAVKRIN